MNQAMMIIPITKFVWEKDVNMLVSTMSMLQLPKDMDFETSIIIQGFFIEKYADSPKRVKFNHHKTLSTEYEYIVDSSWGKDFHVRGWPLLISIKKK
jgi:hypothetical protein